MSTVALESARMGSDAANPEHGGDAGALGDVPAVVGGVVLGERELRAGELPGDVLSESDKRLILGTAEKNLARRWNFTPADKELIVETIRGVLASGSRSSHRTKLMAVRVASGLEKQNQDDDHLAAKWGRVDRGQATDAVQHTGAVEIAFPALPALPGDEPTTK